MTCYPVAYHVRPDKVLVRYSELKQKNNYLSFDQVFQIYSSEKSFERQFTDNVIYALKNSAISLFFVFDKSKKLHLFNSKAEVTRFLKSLDEKKEIDM